MSAALGQLFAKCDFGQSPLGRAAVTALQADKAACRLEVDLQSEAILEKEALLAGEEGIRRSYGLKEVCLQIRYQLAELSQSALEYCRACLAAQYPSFAAAAGCVRMEACQGVLTLRSPARWMQRLEELRQPMQQLLSERLGLQIQVELEEDQQDQQADREIGRASCRERVSA